MNNKGVMEEKKPMQPPPPRCDSTPAVIDHIYWDYGSFGSGHIGLDVSLNSIRILRSSAKVCLNGEILTPQMGDPIAPVCLLLIMVSLTSRCCI